LPARFCFRYYRSEGNSEKEEMQVSLPKAIPTLPETTEPLVQEDRFTIPAHVERWDEYFLNIAKAVSIKSKDPKMPRRCRYRVE